MKKFYLSMLTVLTLLLGATSCSQEEGYEKPSNGVTSFSISLNDKVGSRAVGDGTSVNKLYYQVFMKVGEELKKVTEVLFEEDFKSGQNLDIPLLNGETYSIVFWAQNSTCNIYEFDATDGMRTIRVNYDNVLANQESYDAFYNAFTIVADGNTHKVELRRPFAQLNLGTSDWGDVIVDTDAQGNKKPAVTKTSVKVTGLADTFEPLTGKASASVADIEATFGMSIFNSESFFVPNNTPTPDEYKYLSYNYLLVPGEKAPQGYDTDYTPENNAGKATVDLVFGLERDGKSLRSISVPNAPMQRNWRTNIIGAVLTGTSFDITIQPATDGDNQDIRNIDGVDALIAAMEANGDSENSVTYYVNGLSTLDKVSVAIPSTFKAKDVTFVLNNIKSGAELDITGNTYEGDVSLKLPNTAGHSVSYATIYLPSGHFEFIQGHIIAGTVTTSPNTFVVGSGATFGTLTVKGGNVAIQTGGEVEKITNESEGEVIVILGEDVVAPETEGEGLELKTEKENGALSANSNETISRAVAIEGATVKVKAGDYTFPASVAAGVTIDCEEGTRFIGKSNFNINGATVRGADFWNDKDRVNAGYGSVINAVFEKCSFTGVLGIYEAWAGETCEFIDCHFCAPTYSCNFSGDSPNNPVKFTSCSFMGWSSFGIDVTFNDCVFDSEPGGIYNVVRVYGKTEFNACEFIYGKLSTEGIAIDAINSGKEVKFTNCKVTNESGEDDYIFNHLANSTVGKTFIVDGETYTYQGSDIVTNTAGEYLFHSASALRTFANYINEGKFKSEGKTIKLGADIDLKNENWNPIGNEDYTFGGTFDGNGKTIKNLLIVSEVPAYYMGFFGTVENATIKNVTFENMNVNVASDDTNEGGHIAGVAGYLKNSTLENINVIGDVKVESTFEKNASSRVAVIAGGNKGGKVIMKNVIINANNGSYVKANNCLGALAGQLQEEATFENCTSNIDVIGYKFFAGGIIGLAPQKGVFTNCEVSGNVSITNGRANNDNDLYRVGGIAGGWDDSGNDALNLTGCSYIGTLSGKSADGRTATAFDCGGFVGRGYSAKEGAKVNVNGVEYEYAGEGIYKVGDNYVVKTGDALVAALEKKYNVTFGGDLKIEPANMSNAYGKTGVLVYDGQTIDGDGYKLDVKGAGGTWDSGICTSGGLIKNIWVTGSFRGIFVKGADHTEKIVLDNVRVEGTTYTISIDQAKNQGLEATNSIFRGWTSYAATIGNVKFTKCTFGAGNGYNFSRPYAPTEYVNCNFEEGHKMDPRAAVTFENCTINGVALTADNLATLVTSNIANASVK